MNKIPTVSLLMLNWNGIVFTRKCLDSLFKTKYKDFELILLDNGSNKNEKELLQKKFFDKRIIFLRSEKNLGYAQGMNEAYSHARGKYIMILNNDMEFDPRWLQSLVKTIQSDKKIGACQPKIKDMKNKKYFEYSAAAGGYIDAFGYTFARGRIFSYVEKDYGQYDNQAQISWGGVLLIKREVLEKIGFFDSIYFNYAEDVDLCFRIYGRGYKILFDPKAITYHFGGGELGKNLAKKMFYIHRNHVILILKNWDLKKLCTLFVLRMMLDVMAFVYYLLNGYSDISLSLIKAYISLFTMLPKIIKTRKKVSLILNRKYLKNMPTLHSAIVFEYFFKRKQKFSQLPAINNV